MGAHFDSYSLRASEKQLRQHHTQLQEELCSQYGNDTYAGHLGILPTGLNILTKQCFKSFDEAYDYIQDHHSKWEVALAVSYREKRKKHYLVGGWCPE